MTCIALVERFAGVGKLRWKSRCLGSGKALNSAVTRNVVKRTGKKERRFAVEPFRIAEVAKVLKHIAGHGDGDAMADGRRKARIR